MCVRFRVRLIGCILMFGKNFLLKDVVYMYINVFKIWFL